MANKNVAPPRNNLSSKPLVKQRPDVTGQDPNYRYEWFSLDPRHPSFVERKLSEKWVGDDGVGYAEITEGWEPVNKTTDPRVASIGIRDDQGKGDGFVRNGNRILCRIRKDVWNETYERVHNAKVESDSKRMYGGERESYGKDASLKAIVSEDEAADINQMLQGVK